MNNTELIFGFNFFFDTASDMKEMIVITNYNNLSIFKRKKSEVLIILGEIVGSPNAEVLPVLLTEKEKLAFGNSEDNVMNFLNGNNQKNLTELIELVKLIRLRMQDSKIIKEIKLKTKKLIKNVLHDCQNKTENHCEFDCPEHLQGFVENFVKTRSSGKIIKEGNRIRMSR